MAITSQLEYPGLQPRAAAEGIMSALLAPGERALYVATVSPAIYWQSIVMLVIAAGAGVWSLNLGMYFLVVAAGLFLLAWGTRNSLLLGCTDRRIVCRHGVLFSDVMSLRHGSIESIEIVTTPMGALLGYSDVLISGTGRLQFMVPHIADAAAFREAAQEAMDRNAAAFIDRGAAVAADHNTAIAAR